MTQIPIHPDRGIDPHLTFCPRCGGEGRGLTIGHLKKAEVEPGKYVYANRGQTHKTRKELEKQGYHGHLHWEDVDEYEKVPDSDVCKKCEEEQDEWKAEIDRGGIYWQCASCSLRGVIKHNAEICRTVREQMKIPAPQPCGLEFEKCEEHGGAHDEEKTG